MFRKLRNKFILTNMLITTAILLIAFVLIFVFTAVNIHRERPRPPVVFEKSDEMRDAFNNAMNSERDSQLVRLGITLAMVGVSVEILVFLASFYFAEKSIQPVREAYIKQREFIANASHELKTPIASVQANFEALGATEQPWVDNIEAELTRASKLVTDLLTLARTDGRDGATKKKDINIADIVRERAKLIEARLGDKKLKIDLPEKCVVCINESDFRQVFDILLDNAVKYSKKKIVVSFENNCLSVENDGKAIEKEKIDRVFDRFYQTDKTNEGSGLGLAIAKAVSDQNGWNITVKSEKNLTKFSVSF